MLEFLRNLRDAGVGTNHTENITKELNNETKKKIGGQDNLMDKGNCHRDVNLICKRMEIRISKLSKAVCEAKRDEKRETRKVTEKVENPENIMTERVKLKGEILMKERERLDDKFKHLKWNNMSAIS